MEITERPEPPTGLARFLFRLPLHLYRWRLGGLLGWRLLLLNHVGRVSGARRQVVLEVVERAPDGSYAVCSGFGPRADWYRNVIAHPRATIQVGARSMAVTAQPLSADEGAELMARYATRHPRAAEQLAGFTGFKVDGSPEDYRAMGRELPFVRLVPRH
ncbi:nitroreductase family deazaflavin-dependent oxidoreductase [Streptomonospora sp. S1-112]|uniref:Nitroreductase family deazaflavin-dependent oxidoreductase n=1 Tax=Streptomonospora mangrovi TaxID=2883123 RepID=A0A9X3NRU5_9ACTN|nr:nitroreductase family deazaflavin-dependent oxidoreductase [Streptomonospora mangrovi]MDA0565625.1 nitroreductase family deazaflavin-dependent oxidoreductase [Streptomonospora mangrovi]